MLRRFLSEICHLPTRQTARFLSVLRVSSVGCPVAFCGVLQALLVSRRQQKTGAKAGFSAVLCSPGNAWEVRMVPREGTWVGSVGSRHFQCLPLTI